MTMIWCTRPPTQFWHALWHTTIGLCAHIELYLYVGTSEWSLLSSLSVFGSPAGEYLVCAFGAGWCARWTQGFILVRAEYPYVQFELLVFLYQFVAGGYKRAREGAGVQSLWTLCVCACECSGFSVLRLPPPHRRASFPF